ncbi:MAG: hypothetical protein DME19_00205 [Verrucomicrobia bacterium]|nr:MAG: hypothetical protein DME19_00205 [Verrucomicrobiota bacterium]
MNRLQKKCLIASMGLHALLCLILVVGPAFLSSRQKELDLPILEVIPDRLTDAPFSGGGNPNARPPAPQLQPAPLQPPLQQPKPPKVESKPPPEPKTAAKPEPDVAPAEIKREKPKPEIKVDTTVVKRPNKPEKNTPKPDTDEAKAKARAEAEARRRTARQLLARIKDSSEKINENLSPGTTIELRGPGGEAYANYAQVVKTYYDQAWIDPEEVADDDATVEVKVVIARDGRVISDSMIKRSGIPAMDKSVQNALDRVQKLPSFPEAAKEAQRTFMINFNLKAKRLLG